MKINLVSFDRNFLNLSWEWMKDKDLVSQINGTQVTKLEQEEWFEKLKDRTDYLIFGIEVDGVPIGAAGLKKIVKNTAHVFWYIGEKEYLGKRIGEFIATGVSVKAKELNISDLYAETILSNFRSINLLFKEGYKIIEYNNVDNFYLMKKHIND